MLDVVPAVRARQDESGGEGPDDRGGARLLGRDREKHGGGDRRGDEDPAHARLSDEPDEELSEGHARGDRDDEKPDRESRRLQDPERLDRSAGAELRHDGEDDEAEDVVDDRRAEDDLPFPALEDLQLGEHPRGDPDGRRRHRGPDEDRRDRGLAEERRERVAAGERKDHARDGDGRRRAADLEELREVRLEADLEEQQDDPDFGDEQDALGQRDEPEHGRSQEHSGQKLAQHGGLSEALRELAQQLGAEKRARERDQEVGQMQRMIQSEEILSKRARLIGMENPAVSASNRRVVAASVGAAALLLAAALLVPPILGLANNGDFDRVLSWAGLRDAGEDPGERTTLWVASRYRYAEHLPRSGAFPTTETLLVAAAALPTRLFDPHGFFDVRVLGTEKILILLAAIGVLVGACRDLARAAQWTVAALLVFFLTDVADAAPLNSMYAQSAAFLFLLATAAAAAWIIGRGGGGWWLGAYFACAALFVLSRPQENVHAPILAAFGWILARRAEPIGRRRLAAGFALALCLVSAVSFRRTPDWYRRLALYDAVFRQLLPDSATPGRDLAELGLDPALARATNANPYGPDSPLNDPAFAGAVFPTLRYRTILAFYLRHPERLFSLVERGAPSGFRARPLVLANYARDSGRPPGARTTHFAWWSDLKLRLAPAGWQGLALFLGGNAVFAALGLAAAPARERLVRFGILALVSMAVIEFFVALLGDVLGDLARHLSVFHTLCDLLLVLDAGWAAERLSARLRAPARLSTSL